MVEVVRTNFSARFEKLLKFLPIWFYLVQNNAERFELQGEPKKLHISICLMLNCYSFVKSQPNFIIFGRLTPEYIPNKTMYVLSTSPIACSYTTL